MQWWRITLSWSQYRRIPNKTCTISLQKHKPYDKTDIGKSRSFQPSVLPHRYEQTRTHTQISISISQYTAVVVSTAGNIWRHFESVYISKTLKNTAGARRVIRNQVTKKDCLNSNNSRLCVSLSLSSLLKLALSPLIFHQSHTTCLSTKNKAP